MESILIPLMVFSIPLLAIWTGHVRKLKSLEGQRSPQLELELAALRERVQVLEQIVTEQNTGLAGRFRELG